MPPRVTCSPCAKLLRPVVPKISDRPTDASASRVPNTSPAAVCCATRSQLMPPPLVLPGTGVSRPGSPPVVGGGAEPSSGLSAGGGAAGAPSGKRAPALDPRSTVTVRGLAAGSRSVSPSGSVASSTVTV